MSVNLLCQKSKEEAVLIGHLGERPRTAAEGKKEPESTIFLRSKKTVSHACLRVEVNAAVWHSDLFIFQSYLLGPSVHMPGAGDTMEYRTGHVPPVWSRDRVTE